VSQLLALLRDRYLMVDRRLLALFRISFGAVLLYDVLRRVPHAAMFYSDQGVLPAWLNEQQQPDYFSSPFFLLSSPGAAQIGMLALAGVYLLYIAGWRTRIVQLLALVGFVSLDARNLLVENRGHIEMSLTLVWTAFLPLGDCWSLDARRAQRQALPPPCETTPVTRLAMGAVVLQTAAIYLLNGLQKTGPAWTDGQAVHYVLWQNRAALPLAAWLRMHEPSWLSPLLSHGTVALEVLLAALVLSPFAQRYTRALFFALALIFHAAIAGTVNVWPHSFAIMAVNVLLLPRELVHAASAWRWRRRRLPPRPRATKLRPPPRAVGWLREALTASLLIAALLQMARDNRLLRERFDPGELAWLEPWVTQLRLFQSWSMFVPMPLRDGTLVVDARTADGRRIDPLTGAKPDFHAPLHGPWFHSQLQCDYYNQIRRSVRTPYLQGLASYLQRWHLVQRRPPPDRLVAFEVYWVSSDAPRPGHTTPTQLQRRLLIASPAQPATALLEK
jgi:hypothetical protein